MTDLTPLFRQCVDIVASELGGDAEDEYDRKQTRNSRSEFIIKDTFIKECYEFYSVVADLQQFVTVIRSPYLAVDDETSNSLSIEDKNRIDEEFKYKVQQLYKKLSLLETYEKKREELVPRDSDNSSGWLGKILGDDEPSDQQIYLATVAAHRTQILRFLVSALDNANKNFETIQKKRISRDRQLDSLNFQNFDDTDDLNYSEFDSYHEEEQNNHLSQQQIQLLETENREFLTMKSKQLKQVEKVQQSIVEIINIQNELSFKLQDQGQQINNLMDNNAQVHIDVQMGNKTLNKATVRNKKGANMLVTMCFVLGVLILFVDYISF
ncbi:endoplasmic reticulum t-SNARE [Scheffersomyces stipitis CBS 6054]|uniref:Endoplasmic reticulum t-SNARE n=1 Tax=Scheffersomyces stipitis (strain ATCC 58785 / CBS 6054 / NBRC 10063 / NRRL Y-11545) TaxID=322104 RepID=A3LY57_PICST|nr:endoplasmic reticulum t-SNARE [Scheffersomyces stipitis CBS 6054]ABN67920.2 endoplasmic reticulum t-SNARE [Scheffersomyces stipitis CBS 6054]